MSLSTVELTRTQSSIETRSTWNIPERGHQTSVSLYAVTDKDSELHRNFNCSRAPNLSINVSCDWQRLRASQKPEAWQETLASLHCQDWHRPRVSKILYLKHDSELQCHCTSCQDWQSTKAPKNYTWCRAPNLLKSHYAVSNWSLAAASLYKLVFSWLIHGLFFPGYSLTAHTPLISTWHNRGACKNVMWEQNYRE